MASEVNTAAKSGALILIGATLLGCSRTKKSEVEFQHELQCQLLRSDIEKNASQSDHEVDGIYSVFYSSKMNSCLVAKVIVWDVTRPYSTATVEIDDALDQRTVWAQWNKQQPINMTDLDHILDTHIDSLK